MDRPLRQAGGARGLATVGGSVNRGRSLGSTSVRSEFVSAEPSTVTRNPVEGLRNRQDGGSACSAVGRLAGIVVVILVVMLADVEVEMEKACAELAVVVPVTGRVDPEAREEDDCDDSQNRARRAGETDHGSAETSHLHSGPILPDPHRRPRPVRVPVSVPDEPG